MRRQSAWILGRVLGLAVSMGLVCSPATAEEHEKPNRGATSKLSKSKPLIESHWLAENSNQVVILDVRESNDGFLDGHIPGARLVLWSEISVPGYDYTTHANFMLPGILEFTAMLNRLGVDPEAYIVITTPGARAEDVFRGTKLYWQLRFMGHKRLSFLHGGTAGWVAAGFDLSRQRRSEQKPLAEKTFAEKPGVWRPGLINSQIVASKRDVKRYQRDRSGRLIDVRPPLQYWGVSEKHDAVSNDGHIPSAENLNVFDFVTATRPVRFRDPAALRRFVRSIRLNRNEKVITYCNIGDWASGSWFVLTELLGYEAVSVYDGSMQSWTSSGLPTIQH